MKGNKFSIQWRGALLGTGVAVVTMIYSCAAGAAMMFRGAADMANMDIWCAGTLVGSSLCGALAAMLCGGGPWEGAVAVFGELVVLVTLNAVLSGGQMEGVAYTSLALAGGCGGAVLLRMGRRGGRKRRRRPRKNR